MARQLRAFANGGRHSDINEQMRNVEHNMTPEEIGRVAKYYIALRRSVTGQISTSTLPFSFRCDQVGRQVVVFGTTN